MKKAILVIIGALFLVFVFGFLQNRGESPLESIISNAENPFRIVLCVTEDLRTSMAVNFELDEDVPGYVEYRISGEKTFSRIPAQAKTTRIGLDNAFHRETDLLGLLPGTEYEYRVGGGDKMSPISHFTTMKDDSSSVSFLVLADPQGSDRLDYMTFANNVLRVIETSGKRPDLAIFTGDVVNDDESRIQWNLFLRYLSVIALEIPVAIAIGNHETGSFTSTQIQSMEFNGYFHFPDNGPLYQPFEALNEDHRLPNYDLGKTYSFDAGPVHFVSINSELFNGSGGISGALDEENLGAFTQWLENDLLANEDRWTVSFLHRGPYSLHYESVNVTDRLAPILEEHGVDLVFSGHDHRYSRALYRQGEYVPFSIASRFSRGSAHLVPGIPANRDLNDYHSSEGTTFLVGNSSSVKFYDPRDDDETPVAFQYDEKNPVIPFVEITESSITVTSYVIERSGWLAFFPDSVSVLESFVIRP